MKLVVLIGLLHACFSHAHFAFGRVGVNGNDVGGEYEYIRPHSMALVGVSTSPTIGFTSEYLRCNKYTKPSKTLAVAAGDKISFILAQPSRQRIIFDHPGPGLIYMSKAPASGVDSYDGSGDWFKVMESGICARNGTAPNPKVDWCHYLSDRLEFTIPKTIPPGEYLVRAELLAIHFALHWGEVQVYGECAQLNITGPGGGIPGPLVKIPGIYNLSDPGFAYDLEKNPPIALPYIMPGPKLWSG